MRQPRSDTPGSIVTVVLIGVVVAALMWVAIVLVPVGVRHSAPFGTVQTVDFSRSIAVLGGEVRPNYPSFDRIDLDLRAYSDRVPGGRYDFVLNLQTVEEPRVVRRVAFSVAADRIPASRSAFSTALTTVRFDPIPDSAGQAYYVSLERGPRNADDIVTLWGIQTYSTASVRDVLDAAIDGYRLGFSAETDRAVLLGGMVVALLVSAITIAAVADAAWRSRTSNIRTTGFLS